MERGPVPIVVVGLFFLARHCWGQSQEIPRQVEFAIDRKDYPRAESLLIEAIDGKPDSPQLLSALARVFYLDGKYLNCATALEKAAKLNPLCERDRITLAIAYIELGQFDWASEDLKEIAAADPRNAAAHYWLGRIDYEDQRFASAQARFQKVVELEPNHARACDYLALCLQALGKYEDAANAFRNAIRVNRVNATPSPWPPFDFASLLMLGSRFEEAEPYLRESLKYDPRFAKAHHRLGVLLAKRSNVSGAVEELQRAAVLDRSYPEPLYALARLYRQQGKVKEADEAMAAFEARGKQSQRSSRRDN
ncbi:MAG: tetratricopeptide repeat protein [Bryobacteraceae bacterium]